MYVKEKDFYKIHFNICIPKQINIIKYPISVEIVQVSDNFFSPLALYEMQPGSTGCIYVTIPRIFFFSFFIYLAICLLKTVGHLFCNTYCIFWFLQIPSCKLVGSLKAWWDSSVIWKQEHSAGEEASELLLGQECGLLVGLDVVNWMLLYKVLQWLDPSSHQGCKMEILKL